MEVDATQRAVERAEELGVDIEQVEGTGQDGRVIVDDVEAFAKSLKPQEEDAPGEASPEASPPPEPTPAPPPEPVRVVLNPETGLGGYDFGSDAFETEPKSSITAGEPRYMTGENHEHYRKAKVEVGGVERPVIVKAT